MKTKDASIFEHITKKNRINRMITLLIGSFIAALMYNTFIVPNNLVYGGLGGLAILVNNVFGININLFINLITSILIIISLILLGFKKTSYTIVGFLVYTIMINLTSPLAHYFNFKFDSMLFSIFIHSIITGFGFGLVYRTGFNTGGSDTIIQIIQHYFKVPMARVSNLINGVIIILGAATFGITKSLYAIIFLKIMNFVSDYIVLGVSSSKLCFIKTKKVKEVEQYLSENLKIGHTLIESTNGVGILKREIIFAVVPNDYFFSLKKDLFKIDPKLEFISNDCYTVENGYINKLIKI